MNKRNFFVVLYGPTGVGKSDLAEQLAGEISGEIVNIDVGQFYIPFTIGTAKPDWKNSKIPHHFFDILNSPENLTVFEFRNKFIELAKQIWNRGNVPIVVGGSTFYNLSLFFPPEDLPQKKCTFDFESFEGCQYSLLQEIDPKRASEIKRGDSYRIKRALELWFTTGCKPSESKPRYEPVSPAMFVSIERDRKELYDRINIRTGQMLEEGWIEEVEKIRGTEWEQFLQVKKLIGYPEILRYLNKSEEMTYNELVTEIQKKTRHYAKRQICFGKMIQRKLKEGEEADRLRNDNERTHLVTVNLTLDNIRVCLENLKKKVFELKK